MTNKTLIRVRVWVRARIKIYISHTENTELLPESSSKYLQIRQVSFDFDFSPFYGNFRKHSARPKVGTTLDVEIAETFACILLG